MNANIFKICIKLIIVASIVTNVEASEIKSAAEIAQLWHISMSDGDIERSKIFYDALVDYYPGSKELASINKIVSNVESNYQQAIRLLQNLQCEEALKFDRQAQLGDGKKHSDSDKNNGYKISYSSCVADRTLYKHIKAKNVQSMYLAAGNYERNGDSYSARKVYNAIIERFSSSPWAIKANDRLLFMKAGDDANRRQQEFESNRKDERRKDTQECRNRKANCSAGCSDYSNYESRSSCYSHCNSICSE